MTAYYNEINPEAANWLRGLIEAGQIAPGIVDERSIEDVLPSDVRGFIQCHWFAGVAVWSYALRKAGWPDDRAVWSGSCPCQPFSTAGKGGGQKDARHLWPVWFKLISACQPDIIFGEQVSSALVLGKATNESLQNLRAEFTGSRILQAYRGNSAGILQGLSSHSRQGAVRGIGQGGGHGKISPVQGNAEDYAAGELPDYRSKTARQEERHTLQLGRSQSGNSRGDKRRGVPVIRDLFQFDGEASMEQPIVGQNNPGTGIYTGECSSSFVFSERHDARLGAGDGSSGNGGVVKKQGVKDDERRTSGADNAESNEEAGGAWLDLVFSDLEGSGYACAAIAFPSSIVGAPHIRDRAYWMANTQCKQHQERLLRPGQSDCQERGGEAIELAGFCGSGNGPGPTNGFWRDADWLGCRDGKWRPVEPMHVEMVDGNAEVLGRMRAGLSGLGFVAKIHEGNLKNDELQRMSERVGAQTLWSAPGGQISISEEVVLQPSLHVEVHERSDKSLQSEEFSPPIGQSSSEELRDVRSIKQETSCAPQGRKPTEQRPIKFDDVVRLLPSSLSFSESSGDQWTAEALRLLRSAFGKDWSLFNSPDSIEALWSSFGEEKKNRFRMGFDAARWQIVAPFPLASALPASMGAMSPELQRLAELAGLSKDSLKRAKKYRVEAIRGYGNAINAVQAQAFIEVAMEVMA